MFESNSINDREYENYTCCYMKKRALRELICIFEKHQPDPIPVMNINITNKKTFSAIFSQPYFISSQE